MTIKPEGFSEVGICTRDIDGWVEFLTRVGGFEEIWRGESPHSIKPLWQTPAGEPVFECLLGEPGKSSGLIRLFQFESLAQEEIRGDTQAWDSGGIFDINIRVSELSPFVMELESRDWKGVSRPVKWQFGQVKVREWLARGPDSVIIALIERIAPPLEAWDAMRRFSHVFNSSQIVSDMQRAVKFYTELGFSIVIHHHGPLPGQGGEVLGLKPESAPATPVELVVLQPHGIMEGSIELAKIEGVPGRSVATRGQPYNLGLNLLRFPVSDLRGYAAQLENSGVFTTGGRIVVTRLEPFGDTEIMALQTPDGVWLEFYQVFA